MIEKKRLFPIELTPTKFQVYSLIGLLILEIFLLISVEMEFFNESPWFVRYILLFLFLGTLISLRGFNKLFIDDKKIIVQNLFLSYLDKTIKWNEIRNATIMLYKMRRTGVIKLTSIILETQNKKVYLNNHYKEGLVKVIEVLKFFEIKTEERLELWGRT